MADSKKPNPKKFLPGGNGKQPNIQIYVIGALLLMVILVTYLSKSTSTITNL